MWACLYFRAASHKRNWVIAPRGIAVVVWPSSSSCMFNDKLSHLKAAEKYLQQSQDNMHVNSAEEERNPQICLLCTASCILVEINCNYICSLKTSDAHWLQHTEVMDNNLSSNGSIRLMHRNVTLQEENWPPPLADFEHVSIIFKPTLHLALCF